MANKIIRITTFPVQSIAIGVHALSNNTILFQKRPLPLFEFPIFTNQDVFLVPAMRVCIIYIARYQGWEPHSRPNQKLTWSGDEDVKGLYRIVWKTRQPIFIIYTTLNIMRENCSRIIILVQPRVQCEF